MEKPVALGADHGGFALKEAVRAHLDERGVPYVDYGTHSEASVDYPDMAVPPCEAVVRGECACALLFCGTGVGISMAANKLDGIRACCCSDAFSAKYTRLHNDANALCHGRARCRPGPCLRTGGPVSGHPLRRRPPCGAASPRYPRWSSADIHAEPSRKAEHTRRLKTMSKTMIMDHPLVQHKVSLLREQKHRHQRIQGACVASLPRCCAMRPRGICPPSEVEIETPIAVAKIAACWPAASWRFVPILRAGLGMVDGMLALVPAAKVGHIGMYRNDETLEPGGILLQAAGGYRRAGSHRAGPDAGHRRLLPWTPSPKSRSGGAKSIKFMWHHRRAGRA